MDCFGLFSTACWDGFKAFSVAVLSVGFAVTRSDDKLPAETQLALYEDFRLILTKPIGTGVIMAANRQLKTDAVCVDDAIASMRQSNQYAADIFIENNIIAATDVTGFGLARHAQNLAVRLGLAGCVIDLTSVPVLHGVAPLFEAGITSSLHEQNKQAAPIHNAGKFAPHSRDVLFDPQTSGGLLGVFKAADAKNAVSALVKSGHRAAMIGRLDQHTAGITIQIGGL